MQFKYIEQELLSIKIAQKQYEKLREDQRSLRREALGLQCQLRENMVGPREERQDQGGAGASFKRQAATFTGQQICYILN